MMMRLNVYHIVQYLLIKNVFSIYVLETTKDAYLFQGSDTVISLKPEYFSGTVNETTICFRFFNYKLLDHQFLFRFGSFVIGTSLSKDHSLFNRDSKVYYWPENEDIITLLYVEVMDAELGFRIIPYEIPEWPMNYWNKFCFTLSMAKRRFSVIMNGKMLLKK